MLVDTSFLRTGDIILFSSKSIEITVNPTQVFPWVGELISALLWLGLQKLYAKEYYHTGMVVRAEDIPSTLPLPTQESLYLWEARFSANVKFDSFTQRMQERPETVVIRQITPPIGNNGKKQMQQAFTDFYGRCFETGLYELVNLVMDFKFNQPNIPNTKELFCSELVVETLKRAGVINESIISDDIAPDDFSVCCARKNRNLGFISPYGLGPEITIKTPQTPMGTAYTVYNLKNYF